MAVEQHNCSANVYNGRGFGYRCGVNAKFFERDKWWCHHHAPSKVKAKQEARRAEWDAKYKRREAAEAAAQALADRLTELTQMFGIEYGVLPDTYRGTIIYVKNAAEVLE